MKASQRHFTICRLRENGKISRNECLQNRITRLSAIIQNLEIEGWKFNSHRQEGNWLYEVVFDPKDNEYIP